MNIYFLFAYLFFIVLPVKAHFRFFHQPRPDRVAYHQRPEWIEYHRQEKDVFIEIPAPKNPQDIAYLKRRLAEVNLKIKNVQEKLNFPGVMSLRYRQRLERELRQLKKEKGQIYRHLKEASALIIPKSQIVVEPFIVYPIYRKDLHPYYSGFRKVHP